MDVYEAVSSRRAVRGFTDQPVPRTRRRPTRGDLCVLGRGSHCGRGRVNFFFGGGYINSKGQLGLPGHGRRNHGHNACCASLSPERAV